MAKGASAKDVDFSSVRERGNFNTKRVTEGDYAAIITKCEDAESKKDGEFQYVFTIKLEKYSQYAYPYYCKLAENQLWKLRNLLVAAGMNVPKRKLKLDPNKIVGKRIGVTMEDDEYEGKEKSTIGAVFPVSELTGSAEEPDTDDDEMADPGPQVAGDEDDDAAEEEAPKKKKDKGAKDGKKKKKGKENLEELDLGDA